MLNNEDQIGIVFYLTIVGIIYFLLNIRVPWYVQFIRIFFVCFFVSIPWNWMHLYQIAVAEHQNNLRRMEWLHKKCTGLQENTFVDELKEWYRTTFTFQDDPCLEYFKVMKTVPILQVSPMKVLSYTITTFITDPMKYVGTGISEFFRALLKDLPVILWIPVLIIVILVIIAIIFILVKMVPNGGMEKTIPIAGGDAPAPLPAPEQQHNLRQLVDSVEFDRNKINQRCSNEVRKEQVSTKIQTIGSLGHQYSETDAECLEGSSEDEHRQETKEQKSITNAKQTETDSSQTMNKPSKRKKRPDEPSSDDAATIPPEEEKLPSHTDIQDPETKWKKRCPLCNRDL